MRNSILSGAVLLMLFAGRLAQAEVEYYTIGNPGVAKLCNVTNAAEVGEWAKSNASVAVVGAFWAASVDTNVYASTTEGDVSAPTRRQSEMAAAFPVERNQPDYYLGDALEPPDDVDWDETYETFIADDVNRERFLFDAVNHIVYVTLGVTSTFTWRLNNGETKRVVVVATPIASGRPKNIFWTDARYGGRTVDLTGKFVKFYGPEELLTVTTNAVSTGTTVGDQESKRWEVTSGLYIGEESGKKTLYAAGELQGQVVMAYYDSGTYERIVDVQTVQISRPSVERLTGTVGSQLKPSGRGYDITGLIASPTTLSEYDEKGAFLYQHTCENKLHDLYKAVYALRPSNEQTRNQTQIYWMESDNQGVEWPFEVDEYVVSWPDKTAIYVRGNLEGDVGKAITIPSIYAVELMDYQEDLGSVVNHAEPPSGNVFSTKGAGLSLLKLTKGDDIWFVPIHSVLRNDTNWYAPCAVDLNVGFEAEYRGGSVSCEAEGKSIPIDDSVPGYIYEQASDPVWNANLYSESGEGSSGYASVIYPVTAAMDGTQKMLEVWWSMSFSRDDMPEPITLPALPQQYSIVWPEPMESADIVIASQQGSDAESAHCEGRTMVFDNEEAVLQLPVRTYFSSSGGTILFWTMPHSKYPESKGDSALASFTTTNGEQLAFSYIAGTKGNVGKYCLKYESQQWEVDDPASNGWACVSATWSTDGKGILQVVNVDQAFNEIAIELPVNAVACMSTILTDCRLGASKDSAACQYRMIDNFATWSRELTRSEIASVAIKTPSLNMEGLSCYLNFDGDDDLVNNGTEYREATDSVLGVACPVEHVLRGQPGSPRYANGVISSDVTPVIYRQNDSSACGYNPNEEHAFIRAGSGGYVVWALRNDLNGVAKVSKPGVLVEYVEDGIAKMRWYDVLLTNKLHSTLGASCVAGAQLPGPHPFDFLDTPWMPKTHWDDAAVPPYRDRKGQVWARAAGDFDIFMHYAQQDGFDWPTLNTPENGESVPWLAYLSGSSTESEPWRWQVAWPDKPKEMKIGQTLAKASGGLPEMWNAASMAVVYPCENAAEVAMLTDPTVLQSVELGCKVADLANIGLTTGGDGKLQSYRGKYYFVGLPPALSDRVYLDPSNDKLCVIGKLEDRTGAVNMLLINVLSDSERASLYALGTNVYDAVVSPLWQKAVMSVATSPVLPTDTVNDVNRTTGHYESISTYRAVDHYALTAMGGTNYVTLIENDATNSFCNAGNPIQMHILKVIPEYYLGSVVTREDELNQLSQILGIHYTEAFAGAAGDYVFDWRKKNPNSDGTVPTDYDTGYQRKFSDEQGVGLTSFTVGEQGDTLANMVNTYWTCRYRALEGTPASKVMSTNWSAWCEPPALAEGWVQRVLNNITPYTQRVTDLYNNAVDTSVTMIRQAGGPYEGDVALNSDNLSSVGLIQLYRTIFNKAESMSLSQGIDDPDANKQLLLAAERLADLYTVLGDEAYADAINPTIGFGSSFTEYEASLNIDYGAASCSLFCFDNQVSSLLDEELALLRGRSCLEAPGDSTSPYFNRLVWNFTKGITAGEVAYAVNYNISGTDSTSMDEATAAVLYPQGHGDAYGHYLSALQGYYHLLRHPYFSWGVPGMSEMNVNDTVVNVDYYDEAKFAEAAADVAKVARKTVELTALKDSGYLDANTTNAFGYGEWAVRGGLGALCNWAVANSLLPEEETLDSSGASYEDNGLLHIDRGTVSSIASLSDAFTAIEATCDRVDAGLNPLGLNEHAVPFDLTPIGSSGSATHFEQVRARAGEAFDNAKKVLDNAQTYANRLRLLSESEAAVSDRAALMEDDYNARLVKIYGSPYADDIGPSGTYPQGYTGPDYYHYMWMDLSQFGLSEVADTLAVTTVTYSISGYTSNGEVQSFSSSLVTPTTGNKLSYSLSANGVVVKDADITGERPGSGELQLAYADFLSAYANVKSKLMLYERAKAYAQLNLDLALELQDARDKLAKVENENLDGASGNSVSDSIKGYINKLADEQKSLVAMQAVLDSITISVGMIGDMAGIIGLAVSTVADTIKTTGFIGMAAAYGAAHAITSGLEGDIANCEQQISLCENALERADRDYAATCDRIASWERASDAIEAEAQAVANLSSAWASLAAAQEQVSALLNEANLIRSERELERKQYANNISKMRYNDMFFRKLSNSALAQYDTAFDLARRYAYLAAKAYAYETGAPLESTDQGAALLQQIVSARSLGENDLGGALAKLDSNWSTLKTQLGLNNQQEYATWYSLRQGLFRISTDEADDDAWAAELSKYWVDDLKNDAEFKRHCQPFVSSFGLADQEPGLVIPFATTIDFAMNLFGKPLAFGDSQPDSSYYATKIAAAGVWFEGFELASTPNVYLVPVGTDRMRMPGLDGEIADFDVVDQTIPVPYPITAAELANSSWLPSYLDGELGGADKETRLRRHPSFRARFGARGVAPDDDALDATRLVGRSIWNTRWLLIIPAGTLSAERESALKAFIYGYDADRDGVIDASPVKDIKIGFRTYSAGGF